MNQKKMFGIGAVVLMILVAIAPAVNSMQLNTEKTNDGDEELSVCTADYDLYAEIDDIYLIFDTPVKLGDGTFSVYEISYVIGNHEDSKVTYKGKPKTYIKPEGSSAVFDSWTETNNGKAIELAPGRSISRKHDIKVRTTCDPKDPDNREDEFADQNIVLEIDSETRDLNKTNNIHIARAATFYKDKEKYPDYEATTAQLFAMTPHENPIQLVTTEYNGTEYSFPFPLLGPGAYLWELILQTLKNIAVGEFIDAVEGFIDFIWDEVPKHFRNHRLGWVNRFTYYEAKIALYAVGIVLNFGQFIADTWESWQEIGEWIIDLGALFGKLITTGTFDANLFAKLIENADDFLYAIIDICEMAVLYGPDILTLVDKLNQTRQEFEDWKNPDPLYPWEEDITIDVQVMQIAKYHDLINIACINYDEPWEDEDDDRKDYKIHAVFTVEPEWPYRLPQICVITAQGIRKSDGKDISVSTRRITSLCFSGGTVAKTIYLPVTGRPRNIDDIRNVQQGLLAKLLNFFTKRPVFQIFQNLDFLSFFNNNIQHENTIPAPMY